MSLSSSFILDTPRLSLVGATPALLTAEMHDRPLLGTLLRAEVPPEWPPEYNDLTTMQYMLDLIEDDSANLPWGYFYVLLKVQDDKPLHLIGGCGFKGMPDAFGTVEIGYSLLAHVHGCGYGTEVVAALVRHAFSFPGVDCILAETFPQLTPSIRVLEKNGFSRSEGAVEPGALRFIRRRGDRID